MRYNPYDFLNEEELTLLDQATTTVRLINEVAELRARNNELELEKLKRMKETQERFDQNNAFIGNILGSLINNAEKTRR